MKKASCLFVQVSRGVLIYTLSICVVLYTLMKSCAYADALPTNACPPPAKQTTTIRPQLQRGAKLFMDYCAGCHALRYLRKNQLANDLGLAEFQGAGVLSVSLPYNDALHWFGKMPPDLSLTARERGLPWLYTYLNSFYADANRPYGANNLLFPDVAMPNVLAPLQGQMVVVDDKHVERHALRLATAGTQNAVQFEQTLQDLVSFLDYVAEPSQLIRYKLGIFVIVFLVLLGILVYLLYDLSARRIKM